MHGLTRELLERRELFIPSVRKEGVKAMLFFNSVSTSLYLFTNQRLDNKRTGRIKEHRRWQRKIRCRVEVAGVVPGVRNKVELVLERLGFREERIGLGVPRGT